MIHSIAQKIKCLCEINDGIGNLSTSLDDVSTEAKQDDMIVILNQLDVLLTSINASIGTPNSTDEGVVDAEYE